MKIAGRFVSEPGFSSLQTAATDGRSLGATVYIYAAVLAPIFVAILITGQLGEFVRLGGIESRWTLWHEAPEWFWTSAILLGRLLSVLLGVVCLYLLYRLGVKLRDRWTGRAAAVGLAVTFGFVESARLINEDIPMLVLLLLTILLCLRYVESGEELTFFAACFTAGLAVAFKLTGGSAVVTIGVAYLLRARRTETARAALARPKLLLGGLAVGVVTITVGFPSVLFGGPGELLTRITHTSGQKTTLPGGVAAGIEFWLLRGYLSAFGLPLVVGVLTGVALTVRQSLSDAEGFDDRLLLVATPVVVTLAVFAQWRYVRVHHLLPTLPPLLLLSALGASHLNRDSRGVRVALVVLLVTSATFSAVGTVQMATDPRDEGTDWLRTNTEPGDTVEVYENSIADVSAVHGRPLQHYSYRENNATYNSSLVLDERAYTAWMVGMPERQPEYIQLTGGELQYVTPGHPDREQYPRRAAYVQALLRGEYNYTVVAQFGKRGSDRSLTERILWAGVQPEPESRESTVIILARNDTVEESHQT
ncbi:hypothetical protein BRC96_02360 [Halobacteriales archaeon QS_6_64_34]|nr:MAG: hypothetical protein BRC96_02360 [Halobacteriales archaeon QS_6_64_34]